jgi:hypothetical protein
MSQEPKSFTVNDRRHFTSEGEPREESEEAAAPTKPSPEPQESTPATEPASAHEASPQATDEPTAPAAQRGPLPAPEFGPFIISLASQAGYLLAAEGDEAAAALEDARHLIAIIEMLKDKTEGRRTAGEDQIIDGVLYELRMGYVARTKAGGA